MSVLDALLLCLVMVAFAAAPSTSVALVVTRSASHGVGNGMAVAAGIVLGDLIFVALAVFGLTLLAETLGTMFVVVKYLAVAYLLWLGVSLLLSKRKPPGEVQERPHGRGSKFVLSFLSGLLLTLGDVKAIFFYASLLPTFVDLSAIGSVDVLVIVGVTIVTVGGVKTVYAFAARKVVHMTSGWGAGQVAKKAAGVFLIGAGFHLLLKT